jgi:hypothetical protein
VQRTVWIDNHTLAEFGAKMCPPEFQWAYDVDLFKGVERSTLHLLHNRRTRLSMICEVDFFGPAFLRTANRSRFEALFVGKDPVKVDIGDGFWYAAVLTGTGKPETISDYLTQITYEFCVTRHQDPIETGFEPKIWCRSTVPKTDCILTISAAWTADTPNLMVRLNGLTWWYAPPLTGDMVIDGVHKCFTVGGANVTNDVTWTDFPYLVPGANELEAAVGGVSVEGHAKIYYTPTFL